MPNYVTTGDTRVFSIKGGASPKNAPAYQGCWKAGNLKIPRGDPKIIQCPDPNRYGAFKIVDKIPGATGLPGMTITSRYARDISDLLKLHKIGCDVDLQMHIGRCKNPQDFNEGWDKILVLESSQPGDWSVGDFGALGSDENKEVDEEMPFMGEELYEILKVIFAEQAKSEVVQEIIAAIVCDAISCGDCDDPSEGCEKAFFLTITVGGSPGARAEIIFTGDAGLTWGDTEITSLGIAEDPDDFACVGENLVVVSGDSDSLHIADKGDLLLGIETWTEVAVGIVAAGSPREILSMDLRHTWIVGDGGYVYFTEDPTTGVVVQSAGTVTVENLLALHGYDVSNIVAVGENNALIYTRNGGETWQLGVGPNAGVNLNCAWMRGMNEWIVGCADGTVWYTYNQGNTWIQIVLPNQTVLTNVLDIKFSSKSVGWMAVATATPVGRILRSIDGGHSWYATPEGNIALPANDRINEIAICDSNPNLVYAGGLADDGLDGIILKGA